MALLNVRLSEEDMAKVNALRAKGVQVSELLRNAIRREYEIRAKPRTARDIKGILDRVYAECPDPPGLVRAKIDLTDRKAVRAAISARLKRKRGRAK